MGESMKSHRNEKLKTEWERELYKDITGREQPGNHAANVKVLLRRIRDSENEGDGKAAAQLRGLVGKWDKVMGSGK